MAVIRAAALAASPFLALAAAQAGGWTRFAVAAVVAAVGTAAIVGGLRDEAGR